MISLSAFAKVNLSLFITGVRDDGYHLLDTVMQTVSLYDTVDIALRDDGEIRVSCNKGEIKGENNICYKAAKLFMESAEIKCGADINVVKRIPLAAGLGGGSADAAAVLKGMNMLSGGLLSYEQLCDISLKLGADVPFCIRGGTARVTGIGENIEFINRSLPLYLLLIKDAEKPSTSYMYKEFDRIGKSLRDSDLIYKTVKGLENSDYECFKESFYNDFSCVWNYDEVKKALISSGADAVSLTGSGPTVMGLFETEKKAQEAYEKLKDKYTDIYLAKAIDE